MTNTTTTIISQFQNNSTNATTVSKVVPNVVVNNAVVPDFRQFNPGVQVTLATPLTFSATVDPQPTPAALS